MNKDDTNIEYQNSEETLTENIVKSTNISFFASITSKQKTTRTCTHDHATIYWYKDLFNVLKEPKRTKGLAMSKGQQQ